MQIWRLVCFAQRIAIEFRAEPEIGPDRQVAAITKDSGPRSAYP